MGWRVGRGRTNRRQAEGLVGGVRRSPPRSRREEAAASKHADRLAIVQARRSSGNTSLIAGAADRQGAYRQVPAHHAWLASVFAASGRARARRVPSSVSGFERVLGGWLI